MDIQNYPWSDKLLEVFKSSIFGSLGTIDKEYGVWINTVNMAYDEHFNLYYLSKRASKHMQNIAKDPRVSLTVYRTGQEPHGNVIGLQMTAKAEIVPDTEIEQICGYYFGRENPFFDAEQTKEYYDWDATWKFVKVIPENIWIYDTAVFGDNRTVVPKEIFRP